MKSNKKRGLIGTVGALAAATALALSGAVAANADTTSRMPETSNVTIHKRELTDQQSPGTAADGLVNSTAPGAPLAGVTFTAYPVTLVGSDAPAVGTNAWLQAVSQLTVGNVADGSKGTVSSGSTWSGTTGDGTGGTTDGDVTWSNAPMGVYIVKETGTPAGIVPAADFLLTVPLTTPSGEGGLTTWLDTIHIYPKNRMQNGSKSVDNEKDYKVGDTVTWKIDLPNPSKTLNTAGTAYLATDEFIVTDTVETSYLSPVLADVVVTTPGGLTKGSGSDGDYNVVLIEGTGTTAAGASAKPWQATDGNGIMAAYSQVKITFTSDGRDALADAKNQASPVENVVMTIPTVVNQQGAVKNSAQFRDHSSNTTPKDVPGSEVRYGNAKLVKKSTDTTLEDLSGAEFRVYLTRDAAMNAYPPSWGDPYSTSNLGGYLVSADGPDDGGTPPAPTGIFVTGTNGEALIGGLRASNFASGQTLEPTDDEYKTYWLLETKALPGHQLLGEPVEFSVLVNENGTITSSDIEVTNSKGGGFELPLTGGSGTLLLTILGVGILATVIVVARRRQNASAAE